MHSSVCSVFSLFFLSFVVVVVGLNKVYLHS